MLLTDGARRGLWPDHVAATHQFRGDPVSCDPDVTRWVAAALVTAGHW